MNIPRRESAGCCSATGLFSPLRRPWTAVWMLFVVTSHSWGMADCDFDIVDLVLCRDVFDEGSHILSLSEMQRQAMEAPLEEYLARIQEIEDSAARECRRVSESMPKINILQALRNGDPIPEGELEEGERQQTEIMQNALREGDHLLTDFYIELTVILAESPLAELPRFQRFVRRRVLLPPASATHADFFRSMDVRRLVGEAARDGGELQPIFDPGGTHEDASEAAETTLDYSNLRKQIDAILDQYELRIDGMLMQTMARRRKPQDEYHAYLNPDDPEHQKILAAYGKRNVQYCQVHKAASEKIGAVLTESAGAKIGDAWIDRFHKAIAPSSLGDFWLDTAIDWVLDLPGLSEDQISAIGVTYSQYQRDRRRIGGDVILTTIKAHQKHGTWFGIEAEQLNFAKQLLRIEETHERAVQAIGGLLVGENLAAFRAREERERLISQGLFERWIPDATLNALGLPANRGRRTIDPRAR